MTDIVIVTVIGIAMAAILRKKIKDHRTGNGGCSCGCGGCSGCNGGGCGGCSFGGPGSK